MPCFAGGKQVVKKIVGPVVVEVFVVVKRVRKQKQKIYMRHVIF